MIDRDEVFRVFIYMYNYINLELLMVIFYENRITD